MIKVKKKNAKISPSMMCADFLRLKEELIIFDETDIDYLHIDIMDGHYVPNFTLGPDYCRKLSEASNIPLDIHLMIENVDTYIPVFSKFNNPIICFHPEVAYHPLRSIDLIRKNDAIPGIAIDPSISLDQIKHLIPEVEVICVMTVNPGYSGQTLIPTMLDKISELKKYIDTHSFNIKIEVDGNVSWKNVPPMLAAGADILVAGTSSIFQSFDTRKEDINRLKTLIKDFKF